MGQEVYHFYSKNERRLSCLLFLPNRYGSDPAKKWPLILFLHGALERGDNLDLLKKQGIPKVVEVQPDFPFVSVSPQCPDRSTWGRHLSALGLLLEKVLQTYNIDHDRLYLTGISMGGNGVWQLAVRYPKRFAAIAPVCGYGFPSQGFRDNLCVLKDVPVWVFHGAQDLTVPVQASQKLVKALRACGGEVRFTIYPRCGHDAWTQTYSNPKIYRWFLSHSRNRGRL